MTSDLLEQRRATIASGNGVARGCLLAGPGVGAISGWHGGAPTRAIPAVAIVLLALATGAVAGAGDVPAGERSSNRYGIGVLVASGVGPMASDVNHHPGFGLAVQGHLALGSRFRLRPAFEWTGYRVNDYNLASRLLAVVLGATYDETRVVFRTYRLGIDGVCYFRGGYHGPFVSGGVGVQRSRVYLEDVYWYGDTQQDTQTVEAFSATNGLWLGAGGGYQYGAGSVELRLSRAPYRYTSERPTDAPAGSFPFEPHVGWALHLILAVTF